MRDRRALWIAIALMTAVLVTGYYLLLSERDRQLALQQTDSPRTMDVDSTVLESRGSEEIQVRLYFYNGGSQASDSQFLFARERTIYQSDDPILMARQIISELFKGPGDDADGNLLFPEQARLRQLYLLEDGTVVVDLTYETVQELQGIVAELAAIRSITRSLTDNLDSIRRVRFLVEGQSRPTLAGHISIRYPFM
ncbi:MAG TPA: GerMN domain-containing protein [Acidobacteriota bacterium]|nr:GerMN domain-containing protein [Acidobacteriota bacterium]